MVKQDERIRKFAVRLGFSVLSEATRTIPPQHDYLNKDDTNRPANVDKKKLTIPQPYTKNF